MRHTLMGAAVLLALGATPGHAAPLKANEAGACTLGGGIALAIKAALVIANASAQKLGLDAKSLSVDSIVIRSAANPNGGQPLAGTNPKAYTGAIVCTFDAGLLPPAVPYAIQPTTATTPITDINLLTSQVETWMQYATRTTPSKIKNLLCLSTRDNDNCFNIGPK
jgi:hypothetical protein